MAVSFDRRVLVPFCATKTIQLNTKNAKSGAFCYPQLLSSLKFHVLVHNPKSTLRLRSERFCLYAFPLLITHYFLLTSSYTLFCSVQISILLSRDELPL